MIQRRALRIRRQWIIRSKFFDVIFVKLRICGDHADCYYFATFFFRHSYKTHNVKNEEKLPMEVFLEDLYSKLQENEADQSNGTHDPDRYSCPVCNIKMSEIASVPRHIKRKHKE